MEQKQKIFSNIFKKHALFVWHFAKCGGVVYERGTPFNTRFCGSKRRRYHE